MTPRVLCLLESPQSLHHSFQVNSVLTALAPLRVGVWAQSHPEVGMDNKATQKCRVGEV